jgi:hypothetical protein
MSIAIIAALCAHPTWNIARVYPPISAESAVPDTFVSSSIALIANAAAAIDHAFPKALSPAKTSESTPNVFSTVAGGSYGGGAQGEPGTIGTGAGCMDSA